MKLISKLLTLSITLLFSISFGLFAQESYYPNKNIRLVIPFPAAGPTDILGRVVGQKLSERLGQAVVIENRAGGNGTIGAELVAKAPPDGYTIMLTTSGVVTVNPTLTKVQFDTLRDFIPVIMTSTLSSVLVVNPALGVNSVKDFIQLAKSKPGLLNYASSGSGSTSHLAMEQFNRMADVKIVRVPYKGAAPAVNDLLSGNVQVMLMGLTTVLPFIQAGKLTAIGVSSNKPSPVAPNIPTITGSGLPGFEASNWLGFFVPTNTPTNIVNKLNSEIYQIIQLPEVKVKLSKDGFEPVAQNSPTQFKEFLTGEINRWSKIVKELAITTE